MNYIPQKLGLKYNVPQISVILGFCLTSYKQSEMYTVLWVEGQFGIQLLETPEKNQSKFNWKNYSYLKSHITKH